MKTHITPPRVSTVVIGAGQTGLAAGYYLAQRGVQFVILEANERVGDSWRNRWDSLRLFTSARYDGLPGLPFPAKWHSFPTKDAMADYLEGYAGHFKLPIYTGVRAERLWKEGELYVVDAGGQRIEAENVVVAMANFQQPKIPPFAADLAANVRQLHSRDYRNPAQLVPGSVLVVGAGNSGAEIALDVVRADGKRQVLVSGSHPGNVPFKNDSRLTEWLVKPILLRFIFHRLLTIDTPLGRRARPKMLARGAPLIRVKPADLEAVGVERVARVSGVSDGRPVLSDGRAVDVANVIWCTGFTPGFSWIDLPVSANDGEPLHRGGIVAGEPGLFFVGLHFLYAMSSAMVQGAGRDAKRIVDAIAAREVGAVAERPRVAGAA